jgi:shikimate kinase
MVSTVIIGEDGSIVLPDKKLTRTTKGRYAIYLPITMNDLWQRLHENNVRVMVTIRVKPKPRLVGGEA